MTLPAGDILADTAVTPVDGVPGRYAGSIPEAWRIFYAFGGATMATALRAAVAEVDRDDLRLVSADATFCQAVPVGPVATQVEVLRQGRSGAQALVRLWALDPEAPDPAGPPRADLVLTVVFGAPSTWQGELAGAPAPDVPGPLDCPERAVDEDSPFSRIPYHAQTDFRLTGDWPRWGESFPAGEPRSSSWFRFRVPPLLSDGRWEPATLALPGDILGPAVHAGSGSAGGPFFVISLQISLQFVADVRSEWILADTEAHSVTDGFASGTARLFDEDRRLVAVATQSAKLQAMQPG